MNLRQMNDRAQAFAAQQRDRAEALLESVKAVHGDECAEAVRLSAALFGRLTGLLSIAALAPRVNGELHKTLRGDCRDTHIAITAMLLKLVTRDDMAKCSELSRFVGKICEFDNEKNRFIDDLAQRVLNNRNTEE